MLKYKEFEDIWKKKRCKQDIHVPSAEVWGDITKVFKTCEELYHQNVAQRAMLERLTEAFDKAVEGNLIAKQQEICDEAKELLKEV